MVGASAPVALRGAGMSRTRDGGASSRSGRRGWLLRPSRAADAAGDRPQGGQGRSGGKGPAPRAGGRGGRLREGARRDEERLEGEGRREVRQREVFAVQPEVVVRQGLSRRDDGRAISPPRERR